MNRAIVQGMDGDLRALEIYASYAVKKKKENQSDSFGYSRDIWI